MEAHEAMERFERSEELAEARERFGRHAAVLAAALAILALGANETSNEEILSQAKATDAFNELEVGLFLHRWLRTVCAPTVVSDHVPARA